MDGGEPFKKLNSNYTDVLPHRRFWVFLAIKKEKYDSLNSYIFDERKPITVVSELSDAIARKYVMKCDILFDETCEPPQLNVVNIDIRLKCEEKSES